MKSPLVKGVGQNTLGGRRLRNSYKKLFQKWYVPSVEKLTWSNKIAVS